MTNLIGKTVELPNGDLGVVQAYEKGRYQVFDKGGIGHPRWVTREQIKLPIDQQMAIQGAPTLFDLARYEKRKH